MFRSPRRKPTGAGDTVGAFATKRYRFAVQQTLVIPDPYGFSAVTKETRDVDIAAAQTNLPAFNPVASFILLTNALNIYPAKPVKNMTDTLPKGFVFRVAVDSTLTANNIPKRTVTTVSCDAPVAAQVAASLFEIPAGYRRK